MATTKKQTKTIIITIIAFSILVWQLHGLFSSEPSSAPNKAATEAQQAQAPLATKQTTANQQPVAASLNEAMVQRATNNKQGHYVQLLNQLEVAKMERQVLEQQLAIVKTKHEIATLKDSMQALPEATTISSTAFADNNINNYRLAYIDKQSGQWSASINNAGKYSTVLIGSVLPDGSKISEINKKGVLIIRADKTTDLLSFNGLTTLSTKKIAHLIQEIQPKAVTESTQKASVISIKKEPVALPTIQQAQTTAANKQSGSSFAKTPETAQLSPTEQTQNKQMLSLHHKNYTVQLMQANQANTLAQFAKHNKLAAKQLHIYSLPNKEGTITHTMTYGTFSNEKIALKALKALPKAVKNQQNVKLKSIKTIQNSILDKTA